MSEYLIKDEFFSILKEAKVAYNLDERTYQFAIRARNFIKNIKKTLTNIEYCKQLSRSSSSVGANYIEANEAFSRKDFFYRIKVCRKEAKESKYFLKLIETENSNPNDIEQAELINEAHELVLIFSAILRKHNNDDN